MKMTMDEFVQRQEEFQGHKIKLKIERVDKMFKIIDTKNYGYIEEVKKLEPNKEYGIIGSRRLMAELSRVRPDLISYNDDTRIANTKKAEELQKFLNTQDGFRDYELIFTE